MSIQWDQQWGQNALNNIMKQFSIQISMSNQTIQEQIIGLIKGHGLPHVTPIQNPFVSVLPISSFRQFCWAFLFVGVAYYTTYFVIGSILQYTNPFPKNEQRLKNTKKEILLGISALFWVILYTALWLWKVDPLTPHYGYWAGRENEFTLFEMGKQILIYLVVFDAWFYATHHLLHMEWFMKHVHSWHHQFYEPSAFAQDAVHPFQAVLQGPMGHFFVTLIYPMNPLLISVLGYLTSIYALLAHDARVLDLNDHVKHHHYRNCNYGLYWGLLDYVFGTRYSKKKYPVEYVPSYLVGKGK